MYWAPQGERDYDSITKKIYNKCVEGFKKNISEEKNNVKDFYKPFSHQEISRKIATILKSNKINADLDVIFQEVDSLHKACPDNLGDWYFTGDYPTPGGNRVVNRAFINFYEGKSQRAYWIKLLLTVFIWNESINYFISCFLLLFSKFTLSRKV